MKTTSYLDSNYIYCTIYTNDNITLYSKENILNNTIHYFRMYLGRPYVVELQSLFNNIQFEIVLQYINSGRCQPYIINLLFSDNNIKKELAINLIKK